MTSKYKYLTILSLVPLLFLPAVASADTTHQVGQGESSPGGAVIHANPNAGKDESAYWTPERMKSAKSLDKVDGQDHGNSDHKPPVNDGKSGVVAHPAKPQGLALQDAVLGNPPATAGKIFFVQDGLNYVCSGSVINSSSKSLVATAGHCVHGGAGKNWSSNIVFVPAYSNGNAPYGQWSYVTASTFNNWINSSDFSYDQAFVKVGQLNGQYIVDRVGGFGMVYGNSPTQAGVRIWGWPAQYPFNGQVAYFCDGSASLASSPTTDMVLPCNMNGGASGGPWLKDVAYVFGVTSRRTLNYPALLISTPFRSDIMVIFNLVN